MHISLGYFNKPEEMEITVEALKSITEGQRQNEKSGEGRIPEVALN